MTTLPAHPPTMPQTEIPSPRRHRMATMHQLVNLTLGIKAVLVTLYLFAGPFGDIAAVGFTLLCSLDALWFKIAARD